uniref:G-protein coupled receptors family 2 profile 2 domain-containing protein n=1 Tax=Aplanochytrium stocchinoi TaxID=215587 RepID=A0A7S3LNT9_9STRA|mmetsp:Transcript_17991/g.22150  ORF Transcript_17991/g.22150 Transcript_17991/m.22150 type:complete len:425 (+) Transcript_17991:199-1473(+)
MINISESSNQNDLPTPANLQQQRIYWWCSSMTLFIGMVLTLVVFYEWRFNKAYHKSIFKGFIPMFVGNVGMIVCYLPYHTYNAFSSIGDSTHSVSEDILYCKITSFMGQPLVMMYTWFGMTMVSFYLWRSVSVALNGFRVAEVISTKKLVGSLVIPLILTCIYYAIDYQDIGSYRGLYCGWTHWNAINAAWGLIYWLLCLCLMAYFYGSTYRMMYGHYKKSLAKTTVAMDRNKEILDGILGLSVKTTLIFFGCGFLYLLEVVVSLTKYEVPVEFTIAAGIILKQKIILDPLMILTLHTVRAERKISHGYFSSIQRTISRPRGKSYSNTRAFSAPATTVSVAATSISQYTGKQSSRDRNFFERFSAYQLQPALSKAPRGSYSSTNKKKSIELLESKHHIIDSIVEPTEKNSSQSTGDTSDTDSTV